jgi:hypothetical protein
MTLQPNFHNIFIIITNEYGYFFLYAQKNKIIITFSSPHKNSKVSVGESGVKRPGGRSLFSNYLAPYLI